MTDDTGYLKYRIKQLEELLNVSTQAKVGLLRELSEAKAAALEAAEKARGDGLTSESVRDLAVSIVDELCGYGVSFASDPTRHRRDYGFVEAKLKKALLAAEERGRVDEREECAKVADEYGKISPLHNYGPGGASRLERELMTQGKFIAQDIRARALTKPTTKPE